METKIESREKKLAESKGYKMVYIWEKELKDNKNNLLQFIIERIKENETIET